MRVKSYQDLAVWQAAMRLVLDCYHVTRGFPTYEQFGLTSQLQRAAVSIPANIAEGQGRLRYLSIARGSLSELETHVRIGRGLEYLTPEQEQRILAQADEIGRMLSGLLKALSPA